MSKVPQETQQLTPSVHHQEAGRDDTSRLLAETARSLAEGFTGIAASERKDLVLSIGRAYIPKDTKWKISSNAEGRMG